MSQRYKTTQEERADLLKYQLLRQAFLSKKYYENGLFRPATVLNQELKKQRDFYENIDVIASRVATNLYSEDSPEGRYYRDVTVSMSKKISEEMQQQLRDGIMTVQQYNDLLGYITSTIGTALTSVNASRSLRRMALKNDPVGEVINKQLRLNLTQLTVPAIEELAERAQESRDDIRRLKYTIQHEIPNVLRVGTGQYPQNISQPIPNVTEGERTIELQDYEGQNASTYLGYDPNTNNKYGMHYEQYGDGVESQNSATERFGLGQSQFDILNASANRFIDESLRRRVPPTDFNKSYLEIVKKYGDFYKGLDAQKAYNAYTRKYATMYGQQDNEAKSMANAVNSSESIAAAEATRISREYDDNTSKLNDRAPLPKHTSNAQESATRGFLTLEEQFVRNLGGLPEDSSAHEILVRIGNREQPLMFSSATDELKEMEKTMIDQLKIIEKVASDIGFGFSSILTPNDISEFTRDLERLRVLFSIEILLFIKERLKATDPMQWPSSSRVLEEIKYKSEGDQQKEKKDVQVYIRGSNQLKKNTEAALDRIITAYTRNRGSYGMTWSLKDQLQITEGPPYTVYNKWLESLPAGEKRALQGFKQGAPPAQSGRGKKMPQTKAKQSTYIAPDWRNRPFYRTGAPAMTASILNKNPIMRFVAEVSSPPNI